MIRVLTSIAIALCFIGLSFLVSKNLHSHASVSVLPLRAGKNSPARFSFNNLEIQRYQNARLTSGSHPSAQLRQTIEADLIHETHKCSSKSWSYLKHDPPERPA